MKGARYARLTPLLGVAAISLFLLLSLPSSPAVHASGPTTTMNVSYRVAEPYAGPIPTFTYFYQGVQHVVSLSGSSTAYQVDTGTPWSVTPLLSGSTGTERWATQVSGGTAANTTISFVYYHQFLVNFSYSVVEGGPGPIMISGVTQWGGVTSLSAGGPAWVDAGSSFHYPSLVDPQPGERWVSPGYSGLISTPSNLTLAYNHQYLFIAGYAVSGGGTPAAPLLDAVSLNSSLRLQLSTTNSSFWLDAGTAYSATDPLLGSSSSSRWYAAGASGVASSPTVLSLVYYHQYSVTGSYSVVGGNSPAAPPLNSTFLGKPATLYLTQSSSVYWVDAGAPYVIPQSLPGSSGSERWEMGGAITGTVTSPLTLYPAYYHQYLASLTYHPAQGYPLTPTIQFTTFGQLDQGPLLPGTHLIWGDNGTGISVNGNQAGPGAASGERWVETTPLPTALSSPINATLLFDHQFELTVSYTVSGGGNPPTPRLVVNTLGVPLVANLTSQSESYWLDAGSTWGVNSTIAGATGQERWSTTQVSGGVLNGAVSTRFVYVHQYHVDFGPVPQGGSLSAASGWYSAGSTFTVSATPPPGWQFSGWAGSQAGSQSNGSQTLAFQLTSAVLETPIFEAPIQVSSGAGGSVTYYLSLTKGVVRSGASEAVLVPYRGNITLVAEPSSFLYTFSGWGGTDAGGRGNLALQVESPLQVSADFSLNMTALGLIIAFWALAVTLVATLLMKARKRGARPANPTPKGPSQGQGK